MLFRDVGNRFRDGGAIGSEDRVDLVLGNQLLVETRRSLLVGFIIVDEELDRLAKQAALGVQVLLA